MTIRLDEKYKFNELAAKGGDLYKTVVDNGYPLYIDRLQGGDYINPYEYDKELVEEYKRLLGDKFFGFQMHEWLSNYKNDLNGLARIPDDKWTAEEIKKDVFRRNKAIVLSNDRDSEDCVDVAYGVTGRQIFDNRFVRSCRSRSSGSTGVFIWVEFVVLFDIVHHYQSRSV